MEPGPLRGELEVFTLGPPGKSQAGGFPWRFSDLMVETEHLFLCAWAVCVFRAPLASRGLEACPGRGEREPVREDAPGLCRSIVVVSTNITPHTLFSHHHPPCTQDGETCMPLLGERGRGLDQEASQPIALALLSQDPWRPRPSRLKLETPGDTLSISF